MTRIDPPSESQALAAKKFPPAHGVCLYCERLVASDEEVVHGVRAVAHRVCVRQKVLRQLHEVYPFRMPNIMHIIRECGFTEADMGWDS